ncbi:carboxypeptidase-like regulatory domain-containing protein [Ancylomarina sp. YFZ004]
MKYIAFIAIIFFFISCEEDIIETDNQFGTLQGVVFDAETELPLRGVTLMTNPASTALVSNDNGNFSFSKIKAGDIALSVKKKDFINQTVNINIAEYETTSVVVYMVKDDNMNSTVSLIDPVPGNGANDQKLSITFKWKVEKSGKDIPLSYSVFYYESGSTARKVVGENLNELQAYIDGLKLNTTYYWYVVAKNDGEILTNSPTWSFKTQVEEE